MGCPHRHHLTPSIGSMKTTGGSSFPETCSAASLSHSASTASPPSVRSRRSVLGSRLSDLGSRFSALHSPLSVLRSPLQICCCWNTASTADRVRASIDGSGRGSGHQRVRRRPRWIRHRVLDRQPLPKKGSPLRHESPNFEIKPQKYTHPRLMGGSRVFFRARSRPRSADHGPRGR